MKSSLAVHLAAACALLGACDPAAPDRRLAAVAAAARATAEEAHRCAEDLRAIGERDVVAACTALEVQGSPTGLLVIPPVSVSARPPAALAQRTRAELARREGSIEGNLRLIEGALGSGPAALDRAWTAGAQLRRTGSRLCQARDAGSALAALRSAGREGAGRTAGLASLAR